jgi:hypothetical protein
MINLKFLLKATTVAFMTITVSLISSVSFAKTDVRIMWYGDGETEGKAMQDQLDKFMAQNSDINVILDQVPYKSIQDSLPVQLASGEGPDIARVTDLGGLAKYYKDLTPYLKDPGYWEASFGPFLNWMRLPGDTSSIPGFMSTMTVTGPYVNKTLFEQAGVALLGDGATWEEWAVAANAVAKKLNLPRIVSVQNPYNLLNRAYDIGMSEISCREKVGLLAYSPLGIGYLSGKYRNNQIPKNSRIDLFGDFWTRYREENAKKAVDDYYALAKENGLSLTQMALAFVSSRPFTTSNIIGATTMKQLRENIGSVDIDLDDKIIEKMRRLEHAKQQR